MIDISVGWEKFKAIKADKALEIFYVETEDRFALFMFSERFSFTCRPLDESEETDFVENFKADARLVVDLSS